MGAKPPAPPAAHVDIPAPPPALGTTSPPVFAEQNREAVDECGFPVVEFVMPPSKKVAASIEAAMPLDPRRARGMHVLSASQTRDVIRTAVDGIVATGICAADGHLAVGVDSVTWQAWWRRGVAELQRWSASSPATSPTSPTSPTSATSDQPPVPPADDATAAVEAPYALLVWACERAAAVTEAMAWSVVTASARNGSTRAAEKLIEKHAAGRASSTLAATASQAALEGDMAGGVGLIVSADALNSLLDYFGGHPRPDDDATAIHTTVPATATAGAIDVTSAAVEALEVS